MAIIDMAKVMIVGHKSELDDLIKELQYASIIHLANISDISSVPESEYPRADTSHEGNQLKQLEDIYQFLSNYQQKNSLLQKLFSPPQFIKKKKYENIEKSNRSDSLIEKSTSLKNQLVALNLKRDKLLEQNMVLEPWNSVTIPVSETGQINNAYIAIGKIANKDINRLNDINQIDFDLIEKYKDKSCLLVAVHIDDKADVSNQLEELGFEEMSLPEINSSPHEKYNENAKRLRELENKIAKLNDKAGELTTDFENLKILLEYYDNLGRRSEIFDYWTSTENSFLIGGWIKHDDMDRLRSIISKYDTLIFEELEIGEDETPPVAMKNPNLFSPFQLITRLYSIPDYRSYDPSAVLAVFFAFFFGITLTDAGYGLILSLIALIGLWKVKGNKDVLWIIFWGGIFTILAGLLTGGIFGDLFRIENPYLNVPVLGMIREKLLWFDPMKDPMVFFRLVLFLGVVHIIIGIILGLVSNVRQKRYFDALVDNLTWLVILSSSLAILFASDLCVKMALVTSPEPPLSPAIIDPAFFLLALMAGLVILFGARDEKSKFFRFFIGFLKLVVLSGIFSYLGDILSYIRLMALGMVTAGIGMAINTIAFMIKDVPVIGIILTIIILILGHTFNLAINLLGGFVHTLRLQYVEFFSKFFVGGGKEFNPLSNSGKYVKIIE